MNREEFLDGIISIRQYQRFLNGESSIKNDVIEKLISKLKLDSVLLTKIYLSNFDTIHQKLNTIQSLCNRLEFKKANTMLSEIQYNKLENETNKQHYNYLKITLDMHLNRITKQNAMNLLKELIEYPKLLKNFAPNFVEFATLILIHEYLFQYEGDQRATNYLYEMISEHSNDVITKLKVYEPPLFASLSKTLVKIHEYDKALKIANKGINVSHRHQVYGSLAHLYYYSAYIYNKMNNEEKVLENLRKMFAILYVEDTKEKTKMFENVSKKHLGISKDEVFEY
jgi:tetratricopeptide (TPR) repeat protein